MKWFKKTFLFGWGNIRWHLQEINKMYSGCTPSFYSKKRVESGIAFVVLQWGMIYWLIRKYEVMSTTDFLLWAGIEAAVSGYMINQIEKNSRENINPKAEPDEKD